LKMRHLRRLHATDIRPSLGHRRACLRHGRPALRHGRAGLWHGRPGLGHRWPGLGHLRTGMRRRPPVGHSVMASTTAAGAAHGRAAVGVGGQNESDHEASGCGKRAHHGSSEEGGNGLTWRPPEPAACGRRRA
jgi:hypothetical protein